MNKNDILRGLFCFLSIIVMAGIFWFSSQNGEQSGQTSGVVTGFFARLFYPDFKSLSLEQQTEIINLTASSIRTAAHFGIFFLLGLTVTAFFSTFNFNKLGVNLYSLSFCFLYALSDEIHQLFVIGRSFELFDLVIDFSGILFSLFILIVLKKTASKICQKNVVEIKIKK